MSNSANTENAPPPQIWGRSIGTAEISVETLLANESAFREARVAVFGAPFDGTQSYRAGSRFAPKAVRNEFFCLESYSPYQNRDMKDVKVIDLGDLELPFGNAAAAVAIIEEFADAVVEAGKTPVMIGGEHLTTLGTVRALLKKYSDMSVIQFDAHADMRDEYLGEKLSHATVMRRIWELTGDGRIYQFGVRSGERREIEFSEARAIVGKFGFKGLPAAVAALRGAPVYLSVDLDVLDPSVFPGAGSPEPGGATFNELLSAILELAPLNIVGCDITELTPAYDPGGISTAAACKILRELILLV